MMETRIAPNKANLSRRTDGVHGTPYGAAKGTSRQTKPISGARPPARRGRDVRNKANLRLRVRSVPVRAFRETPDGVTTNETCCAKQSQFQPGGPSSRS
jgi:hypothetical protein